MSRNILLSAVVLISLVGVGGVAASRLHSSAEATFVASPASIDPYVIQATINLRTLPELPVADLI